MNIARLKKQLARPASVLEIGGRPGSDPEASVYGCATLALPGETWPTYDDEPMLPILQLNLREAPYVPDALGDVELLALFFDRAGPDNGARTATDGSYAPIRGSQSCVRLHHRTVCRKRSACARCATACSPRTFPIGRMPPT